ncbi:MULTISPECIES: acetone carboxylase [unclassified Pseudoclavibacter]|uniref:acetone carboxylase n=1 Tax=unclassified Pseudoclavibacter TaxID=2615177 RepID=UPI001E581C7C|nr:MULTISPECIES: acetone carboxylase [unclassified Pseudoclavibacter]
MREGFDLLGALQNGGLDAAEAEPRCSRAGCSSDATTRIVWRNPRIHDEARRKIWLACDEHAGYLADFLRQRDFPVTATAISAGQLDDDVDGRA